jgi:protein O-mannosyl-transferase
MGRLTPRSNGSPRHFLDRRIARPWSERPQGGVLEPSPISATIHWESTRNRNKSTFGPGAPSQRRLTTSSRSQERKAQFKRPPHAPAVETAAIARAAYEPWQIVALCVVLAVVTVVAFRGVRANAFLVYDDNYYVQDNLHIQQGLTPQSITWAFTTFHQSNWHPLTWISHMVDWSLYGNNPSGHHMTNVYLHAANAVLLFMLLFYLTGYLGRAAVVAFLFALHPAHVESVAWIAERKDVLSTFFWLAALLAYAWYVRRPSRRRFAYVLCLFACGLMSKPMVVTLPITLLLLDYWPLRRISFAPETRGRWFSSLRTLCIEKWPLFLMSAISSVITFFAQRSGGAVAALQALPLWARICNAAISYCRYVGIMVWPHPLRAFYFYDSHHISILAAVVSAVVLLLVTAVCWRLRVQRPYCLAGWLWFLVTLLPVIGIVQVGDQAMAERYTYVPFIGLFVAIVWLVGDAVAHSPKIKVASLLLAGAVLVACAVLTNAQVKVWKDTFTLFTHVLDVDPRGEHPNLVLGAAYVQQGKIAEAQPYFDRALVYNPNGPLTLSYSAYCIMHIAVQTNDRRNLPLAAERLDKAMSIAPNDADVLTNAAQWSALMGRPKDEEMYSRKAIAVEPDSVLAHLFLAGALQAQNKLDEAAAENRQVLTLAPDDCDAHNNLGMILARLGFPQQALKEFQLSLASKPDQSVAHSQIARILLQAHQLPQAAGEFTQAVRFDPANASTHNDLGVALFQLGDNQKAIEQFNEALRIDPTYGRARQNLDAAQAKTKPGTK